jgi:hypothetical protein
MDPELVEQSERQHDRFWPTTAVWLSSHTRQIASRDGASRDSIPRNTYAALRNFSST